MQHIVKRLITMKLIPMSTTKTNLKNEKKNCDTSGNQENLSRINKAVIVFLEITTMTFMTWIGQLFWVRGSNLWEKYA